MQVFQDPLCSLMECSVAETNYFAGIRCSRVMVSGPDCCSKRMAANSASGSTEVAFSTAQWNSYGILGSDDVLPWTSRAFAHD